MGALAEVRRNPGRSLQCAETDNQYAPKVPDFSSETVDAEAHRTVDDAGCATFKVPVALWLDPFGADLYSLVRTTLVVKVQQLTFRF